MKTLIELKNKYGVLIEMIATRYNIKPELIAAIIWQESRGNPHAVSHCGARGLMQLMPATAADLGVSDSFDSQQNINGGTKYFAWLLEKMNGNIKLALASYNAGPGAVHKYGDVPPFKETQTYVIKVLKYAEEYRQLFQQKLPEEAPANPPITKKVGNKYVR